MESYGPASHIWEGMCEWKLSAQTDLGLIIMDSFYPVWSSLSGTQFKI